MKVIRKTKVVFTLFIAVTVGGGVAVIAAAASPAGVWPGVVVALAVVVWGLRGSIRRWRLVRHSLPEASRQWLEQNVTLYRNLDAVGRRRFERDVQFFLDEQRFEGVDGIDVTDELRLGVAAGAALLLHGRPDWEWPTTRTILFYPSGFDDTYYQSDYAEYDGMVHAQGPVILASDAVAESWKTPDDGSNVVLHELAHLFDFQQSDTAIGMPSLLDAGSAEAWHRLVRREMQRVRRGSSLLRGYAATGPEELFAVAVENFFERPRALRNRHPDLYAALEAFFQLDPAEVKEQDH